MGSKNTDKYIENTEHIVSRLEALILVCQCDAQMLPHTGTWTQRSMLAFYVSTWRDEQFVHMFIHKRIPLTLSNDECIC